MSLWTLPHTREEIVDQAFDFGADHLRHVLGEKNVEAGIAEIEAHGAEGIGKGISFGGKDARAGLLLAGHQHGRGAIAEEDGGNQVGLRDVLALESERGQFHGNNENIAAGIGAKIIGGAGKRHGTGSAAKFGEGHAADIGPEAHQIDEVCVQGRNHETGAGNGDDQVDVGGEKSGALEALFSGFTAELDGVIDVFIVGLGQGARFNGVVDGENCVAMMNLGIINDGHHGFEAAFGDIKDATHIVFHVVAGDGEWGDSGSSRGDGGIRGIAVR